MAGFPWGAALDFGSSIGGPLIKGLFGNKGNKKQEKFAERSWQWSQTMDVAKIRMLVNDAKKAGIHPLAALGVTGGGGFASPVAAESNSGWSDAVGQGLNSLSNSYRDYQDRQDQAKSDQTSRSDQAKQWLMENTARNQAAMENSRNSMIQERLANAQIAELRSSAIYNLARAKMQGGTTGETYPNVTENQPIKGPWSIFDSDTRHNRTSPYGVVAGQSGMTMGELYGLMGHLEGWFNTHTGPAPYQYGIPHRGPPKKVK
ncbi:MAG: DNA pilot protein [Microvirus sp.]|nr:MAG: DNA pilot protein [Microvirus sp.]